MAGRSPRGSRARSFLAVALVGAVLAGWPLVALAGDLPFLTLDDMEGAVAQRWTGPATPVATPVREGKQTLRWAAEGSITATQIPHDWSSYDRLEIWMHSAAAGKAVIALVLSSDNPDTPAADYFITHIAIDRQGWRLVTLPLRVFRSVGAPAGLGRIDSIAFHAAGWETVQRPGTVLTIDAITLREARPGQDIVLGDMEEDIQFWNGVVPDMLIVKEGQQSAAWLDTVNQTRVQNTSVPPDWRGYEYLCFWLHSRVANRATINVIVNSENPETEGPDYWQARVLVDWEGWRDIAIPLAGMKVGRSPLGWDQVNFLRFASNGWSVEPKADTELRIDDVRLCTTTLSLTDAGIRRTGRTSCRWELRVANTGVGPVAARLDVGQAPVAGLTFGGPEPATVTVAPGGEELVAIEAALSEELAGQPQRLSRQRIVLTAVSAEGGHSVPLEYPALAFYFGCLEPGPHPWLFFSESDIGAMRAKLASPPLRQLAEEQRRRLAGEAYQRADDPKSAAEMLDVVRWTDAAAFWYCITGEQGYLRRANENIDTILGVPDWVERRRADRPADLDSATTARVLASAYDWLYEDLPPDQREAIRRALAERAVEPTVRAAEDEVGYPANRANSNWCGVVQGGAGVAALALLGQHPMAPRWVARIEEEIEQMLDAGGEDGGWTEGPTYWEYGFSSVFQFADALRRATGGAIDLFKHPFCRCTGAFGVYTRVTGFDFVNFGDSGRHPWDASLLLKLAAELGSPELQWAALKRQSTLSDPFTFLWYDPTVPARPPADWPLSKRFRGIDWVFMRSGWGPDATVFALRSGRRDGHSHLDANSFILEAFGQPMIVDVGRGSYGPEYFSAKTRWDDPATRTESHNAILINGANQIPGEDGGRIARFSTSADFDYALADATSTYEGAKKVLRHVLFVRPDYFVIYDEVETEEPSEVAFSLYKDRDDRKRELDDGSLIYEWKKGSLLVKVLRPTDGRLQLAGQVERYYCDRIAHARKTTKCDFLVVLYPLPAGYAEPLPTISGSPEGTSIVVRVERPRGTDTIRISPTQAAATVGAESASDGRRPSFRSGEEGYGSSTGRPVVEGVPRGSRDAR